MLSEEALAAEGIAVPEEVGQHGEAETASGCPRRWVLDDRRSGGTEGSLPCSWVKEGWLPSERERRSRRRSPGGRSLLPSAMSGEEQGTGTRGRLPSTGGSHRRPPGGGGVLGRPPKMSSTIAWHASERLSAGWGPSGRWCPGTGSRIFFFSLFLSPLSRLCLSSSFRLLFSRLVCPLPPGTPRPPWRAPLGGGGSRAQSRGYPRPCEGRWGYVTSGAGAEKPWEQSEAGGVNDNERHLRHSPVLESHGGAPEG